MLRLISAIPKNTVQALKILFCFTLLMGSLIITHQSEAQSLPGNITIEKGGKIWIEGTAGPVDFTCRTEKLSGRGEIENVQQPKSTVIENEQINISVSLPVKSLNCGKQAMNKDMYEALKAERFPMINYQVLDASLTDESADIPTGEWVNIRTRGIMKIAGVPDTTSVFIEGKILDDIRFQVKGSKNIHMDTYDIDPPSKMLGLIRANKDLTIRFNVTVILNDTT